MGGGALGQPAPHPAALPHDQGSATTLLLNLEANHALEKLRAFAHSRNAPRLMVGGANGVRVVARAAVVKGADNAKTPPPSVVTRSGPRRGCRKVLNAVWRMRVVTRTVL